jgi:rRNA processing protein Krr1/Pno1
MKDIDVKIYGHEGKISYIGKLKNIENAKSAINNIINP